VGSGESISSIAKKYKVEEERLLSQNELTEDSVLQEGEEIIVPGVKKSPPKPKVIAPKTSSASYAYGRETAGQLLFPTQGRYTQYFHYGHYAVDIAAGRGTPIYAAQNGTIIRADYGWNGGYGNVIVVDHGNGMQTLYAHNTELLVSVGQYVERGQPIATMGNTGRVYGRTGVHLHFEVIVNGVKKNPVVYF
jgi:murein DD-endopeptidase MepM/ murein hydrolase activator NlpD